jgi:hypothetical protein
MVCQVEFFRPRKNTAQHNRGQRARDPKAQNTAREGETARRPVEESGSREIGEMDQ